MELHDVCLSMTPTMTNKYEFIIKDSVGEMDCAAKRASYMDITRYYNIPRRRMSECDKDMWKVLVAGPNFKSKEAYHYFELRHDINGVSPTSML